MTRVLRSLQAGRRSSRASAVALAAGCAVALTLTGCSGHSAAPKKPLKTATRQLRTSPGLIYGVRTTADDRSLVIGYGNGGCGIASGRAEVVETPRTVTVTALVSSGPSSAACPVGGLSRTLVAHLHAPLGHRRLIDGATHKTIKPFDGSALLRATRFPDALTVRTDDVDPGPVDDTQPDWTQIYSRATAESGCGTSPHISVTQGTGINPLRGGALTGIPGRHTVGDAPAQLFHVKFSKQAPGLYALRWKPAGRPGWVVLIYVGQQCESGHGISSTQLMHFANGLK